MLKLSSDKVAVYDIDDTLIYFNPTTEQIEKHGIRYEYEPGMFTYFVPHLVHIEQLKKHRSRGHCNIVWSAGGVQWCETVVKLLELEPYVDLIICKPSWAYDDLPASEYMPKSQWLKDEL